MPLNVVRGGGTALRSLYLNSVSRPFGVVISHPHARRVCLAAHRGTLKPIVQAVPAARGILSRQLVKTYATTSEKKTGEKKTTQAKKTTKAAPKKNTRKTTQQTPKDTKNAESRGRPRRGKKELTPLQREKEQKRALRAKIVRLKQIALKPPKVHNGSYWVSALTAQLPEALKVHKQAAPAFKLASERARKLSEEELDHFRAKAKADRARDLANLDKWVKSHTPAQIRAANHARSRLNVLTGSHILPIKDDRAPRGVPSAFILYCTERTHSGDFKHLRNTEASGHIAEEWKRLTDSEKEKYEKMRQAERERYLRECQEVYGDANEPSDALDKELDSDVPSTN